MSATRAPTMTGPAPHVLPPDDAVQILLVDDQPANLDALEATLALSGCRYVLARSANDALMALLDGDFAAIVLDVMMPGMSGFELAAMIKRRQRTQQVPILFLTARMLDQEDELKGYGAGAVDYLTKPLNPQILRSKIAVFVDLHRKRRALARMNVELQRQIAERHRVGDALRRANEELEARVSERTIALAEAGRRKDEFLAMLAHELRNPLSALRSATEALRLRMREDGDLQTVQGVFHRQVQQLTRLTNDLLDVSRITRDKLTLQKERVVLADIVAVAAETVRPYIEQRKHTFSVDLPKDAVHLEGDAARLAQVIGNVLDNAARYSPVGSRIAVSASLGGDHVLIKVVDDGNGIEGELLPRIFDLFVAGQRAPNVSESGLGIGLPLARRLTEMHGGTMTVYSAGPGRGTEVTVRLPIVPRTASLPSDTRDGARGAAPPLPARRVLIVEDNHDTAAMMNLMLTEWGQETRIAHDGIAALAIAEEFQPDVVLLDIGLPRLHGYEVARRMRQQSWARNTFLVAITGWGREGDRQSDAAGVNHRLLKPVDPIVLRDLLAERASGRV